MLPGGRSSGAKMELSPTPVLSKRAVGAAVAVAGAATCAARGAAASSAPRTGTSLTCIECLVKRVPEDTGRARSVGGPPRWLPRSAPADADRSVRRERADRLPAAVERQAQLTTDAA